MHYVHSVQSVRDSVRSQGYFFVNRFNIKKPQVHCSEVSVLGTIMFSLTMYKIHVALTYRIKTAHIKYTVVQDKRVFSMCQAGDKNFCTSKNEPSLVDQICVHAVLDLEVSDPEEV